MPTSATESKPARKSFRETQFEAREEAIVTATNELLATKGYDTMVMDDIAGAVGIAKGSLYKHFASKEALAAAVMIRLLRRTMTALDDLPAEMPAWERIQSLLEWTLRERLAGGVPHLPSTSQALRDYLTNDAVYVDELMTLSDAVGELIEQARADGTLRADLDDAFVLYTIYARSCDPTLDFLHAGGAVSDDEIIRQMVSTTMNGLRP
jgi:AcrR family transcriptional regulator